MTIADCLQMDQLWLQHWYQVVSYTNKSYETDISHSQSWSVSYDLLI